MQDIHSVFSVQIRIEDHLYFETTGSLLPKLVEALNEGRWGRGRVLRDSVRSPAIAREVLKRLGAAGKFTGMCTATFW